jgi:hypothetical protein
MNCALHTDVPATAYCRVCGKPLCETCKRVSQGAVYCAEHDPAPVGAEPGAVPNPEYSPYSSPYNAPAAAVAADGSASPGLAFLLGLIPGVGAIYNGQYVKGLIHVVVLGLLISIVGSDSAGGLEPLFGMLIGVWVFYMAFEAYHTARKRQLGVPVDEFSSLVPLHSERRSFPVGPVILIALGCLFLLNNFDLIRFSQLLRYWPIALIGLGGYMLYERLTGSPSQREVRNGER